MGIYCLDCCVKLDEVNGYFRYARKDGVKIYGERCRICRRVKEKEYRTKNKISLKYKEYNKEYQATHQEHLRECAKRWRAENKDVIKAKKLEAHRAQRKMLWAKAIEFFGPCACCGETRIEFLSIDHINGGGNAERKQKKVTGWTRILMFDRAGWPDELKEKYRILCHNCNQAYGIFGYCPHVVANGSNNGIGIGPKSRYAPLSGQR